MWRMSCGRPAVSFFFPLNYCDPTAQHYSVMYPLKLARGLPGKFNVFFWCLHGTSLNMNGKFFSTKGCSSSSTENLGKIKDSNVPDFLIWGWVVNEAALRSSFSSSQSGVGRFIRKIPSQFPLSWLLQPEPGGSAALGEIYGSLKASNFAPCRGSEKDLRFWCFHRSCGWIQVFLMLHIQVKGAAVVGFCLALWFFFFFLSFMWTRQCLIFFRALLLRTQLIFVVQFTLKMWSYLLGGGSVHTR